MSIIINTPLSNYASVPANNNLKSRLVLSCARKYSKIMHSSALASTSAYCSQELKHNSKVVYQHRMVSTFFQNVN